MITPWPSSRNCQTNTELERAAAAGGGWGATLLEAYGQVLEDELAAALDVKEPFLNEACGYLLRAGGKRLRPVLVLLSAQAGPQGADGVSQALPLAVACEILHAATLIHDDLVDGSAIRRGLPTLSARWGDKVAILCGDYLFSRAVTIVSELGRSDVSARLGRIMQLTCEAEIRQIVEAYDLSAGEQQYLENIKRKSALLIAECCCSGALLADARPEVADSLCAYGEHVGIAFQIADDILDFTARSEAVGKPTGRDIGLGVLTLPAIKALEESDELRVLIRRRLSQEGDIEEALAIVRRSRGVEYARLRAEEHVAAALEAVGLLASEEPRPTLEAIARFAIQRSH